MLPLRGCRDQLGRRTLLGGRRKVLWFPNIQLYSRQVRKGCFWGVCWGVRYICIRMFIFSSEGCGIEYPQNSTSGLKLIESDIIQFKHNGGVW